MVKNKISQLLLLLLITLPIYYMGFFETKNTYVSSKIVLFSMAVSLLILLVLLVKKYNIFTDYSIVYGTIGINNAICSAILNSLEIGKNHTQQAIILGIHIVIFVIIILLLEIGSRRKKHSPDSKTSTIVSKSLITSIIGMGLFLSRYLMRFNIDIRVVGSFSCGFFAFTFFYVFLIPNNKSD